MVSKYLERHPFIVESHVWEDNTTPEELADRQMIEIVTDDIIDCFDMFSQDMQVRIAKRLLEKLSS